MMEVERKLRKPPIGHQHRCPECGERWECVDKCLATCHCIGRPACTHYRCRRCRDIAGSEPFVLPVMVGGGP